MMDELEDLVLNHALAASEGERIYFAFRAAETFCELAKSRGVKSVKEDLDARPHLENFLITVARDINAFWKG